MRLQQHAVSEDGLGLGCRLPPEHEQRRRHLVRGRAAGYGLGLRVTGYGLRVTRGVLVRVGVGGRVGAGFRVEVGVRVRVEVRLRVRVVRVIRMIARVKGSPRRHLDH